MRLLALAAAVTLGCGDNALPRDDGPASPDAAVAVIPTYLRDVAPILGHRCGGCHVDGGVAPFTLDSYAQASLLASAITEVTQARTMPPWPADASGACGTFVEPRWLADDELATLAAWEAAGAPLGTADDTSLVRLPDPVPFVEAVALGSADAYAVMPGPDEYRCFVVDPGLAQDRFITALAMRLDRAEVVHHVQLFAADDQRGEDSISERDASDPGPGYACDRDGVGRGLRYIGVWAGGDVVRRWPDGTGIRIEAGHRLVVQLHYHNHGNEPVLDRSAVALELADAVEREGRIESVQATHFELPPQLESVSVTMASPLALPGPQQVRGARIHMHGLGVSARMEIVRGDGTECVLDIPHWDEDWQLFYRFTEPLALDLDDQLRIRCTYDTRSVASPVAWGNGTDDEMCIAYVFATP